MKKFKNLVIGGIENKIFNLILIAGLLITATFLTAANYQTNMLSGLSAETNERQLESMTEITSGVMEDAVEQSMSRSTELEALIVDEVFNNLAVRVQIMAEYAHELYTNPSEFGSFSYAGPDPARNGEITAQLILADGVDGENPELASRIATAANMSEMMISLFGASTETNSCFIALPEGAFLVVDDRSGSKFSEDGKPVSYDPRTRPWYQQAVQSGKLIFTDVEIDAFTGDIGIVCAMPVYVNGRLEAVVGSDLFLTSMQEAVQASDENGFYVFVVNQYGHVVFSPKTEGVFRVVWGTEASDLRLSDNKELADLVREAMLRKTEVRLVQLKEGASYMIGAPMQTVGWALFGVFSHEMTSMPAQMLKESYDQIQEKAAETYNKNINAARTNIMILLGGISVLILAATLILGKRIVKPINTITKRIAELNEENLEFRMEDAFRTGDEIEVLAQSFATLSHKTVEYVGQVKRVTAEKERINSELTMAKEIQGSQLPRIFPPYPNKPSFDLYASMTPAKEVGGDFYDFFLVDDDHLALVMADVSGKGVPAALFMMIAKTLIKNRLQSGESLGNVMANVNNQLMEGNEAGMFVTAWVGVLTLSTGEGVAINAGHEHPAVKRADGKFELMKYRHSLAVAVMENVRFKEHTFKLNPGDCLFVYTDGVLEATNANNELMGEDRLTEALNCEDTDMPDKILYNVKTSIDRFVDGAEQFDDITMLCLTYHGIKGEAGKK